MTRYSTNVFTAKLHGCTEANLTIKDVTITDNKPEIIVTIISQMIERVVTYSTNSLALCYSISLTIINNEIITKSTSSKTISTLTFAKRTATSFGVCIQWQTTCNCSTVQSGDVRKTENTYDFEKCWTSDEVTTWELKNQLAPLSSHCIPHDQLHNSSAESCQSTTMTEDSRRYNVHSTRHGPNYDSTITHALSSHHTQLQKTQDSTQYCTVYKHTVMGSSNAWHSVVIRSGNCRHLHFQLRSRWMTSFPSWLTHQCKFMKTSIVCVTENV